MPDVARDDAPLLDEVGQDHTSIAGHAFAGFVAALGAARPAAADGQPLVMVREEDALLPIDSWVKEINDVPDGVDLSQDVLSAHDLTRMIKQMRASNTAVVTALTNTIQTQTQQLRHASLPPLRRFSFLCLSLQHVRSAWCARSNLQPVRA